MGSIIDRLIEEYNKEDRKEKRQVVYLPPKQRQAGSGLPDFCGNHEHHLWDKTEGWQWSCVRCDRKRRPRLERQ